MLQWAEFDIQGNVAKIGPGEKVTRVTVAANYSRKADSTPSLSIAQGRKWPIFKCHPGCKFRDIMRALRALKIEVGTT